MKPCMFPHGIEPIRSLDRFLIGSSNNTQVYLQVIKQPIRKDQIDGSFFNWLLKQYTSVSPIYKTTSTNQ